MDATLLMDRVCDAASELTAIEPLVMAWAEGLCPTSLCRTLVAIEPEDTLLPRIKQAVSLRSRAVLVRFCDSVVLLRAAARLGRQMGLDHEAAVSRIARADDSDGIGAEAHAEIQVLVLHAHFMRESRLGDLVQEMSELPQGSDFTTSTPAEARPPEGAALTTAAAEKAADEAEEAEQVEEVGVLQSSAASAAAEEGVGPADLGLRPDARAAEADMQVCDELHLHMYNIDIDEYRYRKIYI